MSAGPPPPLPPFKPGGGARSLPRSQPQFFCEPIQIVCDIDVIKSIGESYGQIKISCACQESLHSRVSAHSVVGEERGMTSLCPHQIVASVVRWSND